MFALLTFLFPVTNGIMPENVALADVQEAFEKQESAATRGTRTCTFETDDGEKTYALPVLKRISNLGYSDKTFDEDELLDQFSLSTKEADVGGVCSGTARDERNAETKTSRVRVTSTGVLLLRLF